jgi:hypothetical protein
MRTHLKLVTLSVAVVAGLLVAYWGIHQTDSTAETTQVAPEQALEQPASEETTLVPVKEAEPVEEIEPPAEPVNIAGNYEYFDEEGISAEAAEEYRQMAVLPYNPSVVECEHQWTTHDGRTEAMYAEVCTYKRKYPEHPYFEYDTEGLIELVKNGDALAAAVLSERFVVDYPTEALAFALHSTFATNKPDQLLKIANTQYRTNGVPQKIKNENMTPRYIFTSIAQKMGHPAADLAFAEYLSTEELVDLELQAQRMYLKLKANTDAGIPLIGDFNPFVEALRKRNILGDKNSLVEQNKGANSDSDD